MKTVLLGLGSNTYFLGKNPVGLLAAACRDLQGLLRSPVFSCVYESKPMYVENQENFFNMAVKGFAEDSADPFVFLEKIHKIEKKYGRDRDREIRFGPRPLDIDIEEFGGMVVDEPPELILPHPRVKERQFVLLPALEILTTSADEQLRAMFKKFLSGLPDQGVKKCPEKIQVQFRKELER